MKAARVDINMPDEIVGILRGVLPGGGEAIALHEPVFAGQEWKYVKECIDTGWVSSAGSYVEKFEKRLADICGVPHAVVTVNGTAALHIALKLAGVEQACEVLMPALTFVATANAVSYCGAVPHFVDCDPGTLGIDAEKLASYLADIVKNTAQGPTNKETGRRIAAILPVHVFGHPVDMDPILKVAEHYNIPVVEDAAEALGSQYKGRMAGSLGNIAALSFNGNKIVTTGGGGAILTQDKNIAERARHITTVAKQPHQWAFNHDEVGYNYRMPNINAALGCAQLEQLGGFLDSKRNLAALYEKAFSGLKQVTFFKEPSYAQSNYWLNAILLDEAARRDEVLEALHRAGFLCRPVWTLMHELPMYRDCPRMDLAVSLDMESRIINLPSSANLTE